MIKLDRPARPSFLTDAVVAHLTERYKLTRHAVWLSVSLKEALLEFSFGKCAYCECMLGIKSVYLEVDHFKHKHMYPDFVLDWLNLLPSCKRCNSTKGAHDVEVEPIIDPSIDNPKQHFNFRLYRLVPVTDLGKSTVGVLDLNNTLRVTTPRFAIGESIQTHLLDADDAFSHWKDSKTTRRKNKLIRMVEAILVECIPTAEYSAVAATILHNNETYRDLRSRMVGAGLWTTELKEHHYRSSSIALNVV